MSEDKLICRCQEVSESEIIQAIKEGAVTVDGVKRRTGAGMGLCQGKTCGRLIQKMIVEYTSANPKDVLPPKSRMPVRPVKTSAFGGDTNE